MAEIKQVQQEQAVALSSLMALIKEQNKNHKELQNKTDAGC